MAQTPRSIEVRVDIENMPEVKARVEAMIAEATDGLLAERDALAATVERVTALCAKWTAVGPEYVALPDATAQLRAALAPSDPATDTGGEGQAT